MGSKYKTTVEKIESLIRPEGNDSDEDLDLETRAKVVPEFQEDISEEPRFQRLKQSIDVDDDPRYFGRKASRKALRIDGESFAHQIQQYYPQDSANDSDEKDATNEEESSISGEGSLSENEIDESNHADSFQHMSSKDVNSEVEKGQAVKNQLNLWDKLLECRIRMQKCLTAANQFPQHSTFHLFVEQGGQDFTSELKKNTSSIQNLLDKFVDLQHTLVKSYSETSKLNAKVQDEEKEESDEEIPSDTESEHSVSAKQEEDCETDEPPKKFRCVDDYEKILGKTHKDYLEYRNEIIQKWNERTRIASGKANSRNFSAFEQSTLKQIEQVLSNRNRLIQRTRLKRSVTEILGEPTADQIEHDQTQHNPEIFDDSDFYHQLLRELIERRAGDERDPAALGRRWAMLQQMRSRMKRRIDVRATKGRRVRYNSHVKLVGFMAPQERDTWTDQATNELFSSLFGSCTG